MTQKERLDYLIDALGEKQPQGQSEKERMFRALVNLRPPIPASDSFLRVQDAYLKQATHDRGITDIDALKPARDNLYLWCGDITTLRVGLS